MSAIPTGAPAPHPAIASRGRHGPRMRRRRHWGMFVGLLLIALLVPGAIGAIVGNPAATAACVRARPCGAPPTAPVTTTPLTLYRSSALGFQLGYAADEWTVKQRTDSAIQLNDQLTDSVLVIRGAPASTSSPAALLADGVDTARSKVMGLTPDTSAEDTVLGPILALHPATAVSLQGSIDTPQAPGEPVDVFVLAGGDRDVSLLAILVTSARRDKLHQGALRHADAVLGTLRLPGDVGV